VHKFFGSYLGFFALKNTSEGRILGCCIGRSTAPSSLTCRIWFHCIKDSIESIESIESTNGTAVVESIEQTKISPHSGPVSLTLIFEDIIQNPNKTTKNDCIDINLRTFSPPTSMPFVDIPRGVVEQSIVGNRPRSLRHHRG
jgi:hypothetical protein